MNGKIKAFYECQGMAVNGNKAYGIVRGYETSANVDNSGFQNTQGNADFPYKLFVAFFATSEQKTQMETTFRNAALKFFKYKTTECGMQFSFTGWTIGNIVKRLPEIFDLIYNTISENGGKTSEFCPYCGDELVEGEYKRCYIDGNNVNVEFKCVDKINEIINAENAEFNAAPNNVLRGTAGALIGGVVGAGVAVLLLYLGYVAFISAVVSVLLGCFLYQKFGGKPNWIMLVIVCVVTMVFMALAVVGTYVVISGIETNNYLASQGINETISAFEAFSLLMEDEEVSSAFYSDLFMSLLFAVIGMVIEIVYVARSIKRKSAVQ